MSEHLYYYSCGEPLTAKQVTTAGIVPFSGRTVSEFLSTNGLATMIGRLYEDVLKYRQAGDIPEPCSADYFRIENRLDLISRYVGTRTIKVPELYLAIIRDSCELLQKDMGDIGL